MGRILLIALAGALLAGCAMPDASREAGRNLQSTQPDRSAQKMMTVHAFSR